MVRRIAWILAVGGLLPFLGGTIALLWGDAHIRVPAIAGMVTFAAIVLSQLAGVESGLALREEFGSEKSRALALGLSTVPALAAWGVLWLPSPQWQLGASMALFVAVWIADLWLARSGLIPSWFVDIRTAATAVVAIILGVALYLL